MTTSKSVQLAISCGLFLGLFFLTSLPDLAFTVLVTSYLVISGRNYKILLAASFATFIAYLIFRNFDITLRFIYDLSIDAYILFFGGALVYLKLRKDFILQLKQVGKKQELLFSRKNIMPAAVSIGVTVLLFPILGEYLAVGVGYSLFCYLARQFNGKIAAAMGLVIFSFAAGFLLTKKTQTAENLGNFAYFLLVLGAVQELINLIKRGKSQDISESVFKKPVVLPNEIHISSKGDKSATKPMLIFGLISFFASFALIYFLSSRLSLNNRKFTFPPPAVVPTPTLGPIPTISPVAKLALEATKLSILVLNGTQISGLAASTAGKLKENGFADINVGNAAGPDYKTWEISIKRQDEELISFLKRILNLNKLVVNEATGGAKFDLTIIAGEEK